jgi:hypothetical protein
MRYVPPDTKKIDLSDGDWIEVKKFLNAGEDAQLAGAGVPAFRNDPARGQAFDLDFAGLKYARILAYVTAWSFDDAKGRRTEPTRENVYALDKATVEELDAALDAHIKAMEAEKNAPTSAPAGAAS